MSFLDGGSQLRVTLARREPKSKKPESRNKCKVSIVASISAETPRVTETCVSFQAQTIERPAAADHCSSVRAQLTCSHKQHASPNSHGPQREIFRNTGDYVRERHNWSRPEIYCESGAVRRASFSEAYRATAGESLRPCITLQYVAASAERIQWEDLIS
jgi:hypothetical protein